MTCIRRAGLTAALLLGLAAVAAGCAAPEDERKPTSKGIGLPGILAELRRNPENRAIGEAYCRLSITQSGSDFPFRSFFSGLFAVPEEDGGNAFCAALVESVVAGDLTDTDLAQFDRRRRSKEPLGTLLRKVLAAHLRLSGMTAVQRDDGKASWQL